MRDWYTDFIGKPMSALSRESMWGFVLWVFTFVFFSVPNFSEVLIKFRQAIGNDYSGGALAPPFYFQIGLVIFGCLLVAKIFAKPNLAWEQVVAHFATAFYQMVFVYLGLVGFAVTTDALQKLWGNTQVLWAIAFLNVLLGLLVFALLASISLRFVFAFVRAIELLRQNEQW